MRPEFIDTVDNINHLSKVQQSTGALQTSGDRKSREFEQFQKNNSDANGAPAMTKGQWRDAGSPH
jgi:hypothetical protein